MSRFRIYPPPAQVDALAVHCAHVRFGWNLAVEQLGYRYRGQRCPGYAEQDRQLTEARAVLDWLGAGSSTVQQQALPDFHQAVSNWRAGTHRRPNWRKRGRNEGFRVVGAQVRRVEQLNRRWSRVLVPKVGWVRFRRTRPVPDAKSYRVTLDPAVPAPILGPRDGSVVGIDRGVTVTLALSDGTVHQAPTPADTRRAARKLSRCKRGSGRRAKAKRLLARRQARNKDRRKDFVEQASTRIARSYDLIRIEDLRVASMTRSARGTLAQPGRNVAQKTGLNRSILASGWGKFATRLEQKAPGRVEKVNPAFSSQRCSVCGHVAAESRKSQALFACVACGHTSNADLNTARNIAAGRVVTARGATGLPVALNREPQHVASPVA